MEFFPQLELSLLGGWLSLLPMILIQMLNIFGISPEARKRLFERSNYSFYQKILLLISKSTSLALLFILILTPLSIVMIEIVIGLIFIGIGVIGVRIAVLNFVNTSPDEPVIRGLYKYSRNPQEVMLTFILFGACLTIGSWSALLILGVSRVFNHISIVAQEQACIRQYGDSFKDYMTKVPRYFLFF